MSKTIAVTGANSSVGALLLERAAADFDIIAGVRNTRAAESLPDNARITPRLIDYGDPQGIAEVLSGADSVVHLAGILIETKHSNYASANIAATASCIEAAKAAGVKHFLFISVVGADPQSRNAYFRSKGVAEQLVLDSGLEASILRTPILLGPGSAGAQSLKFSASKPQTKVLGGGQYRMRPLDIDDLNTAILKLCGMDSRSNATYELVGPQAISYADLIRRAAHLKGNEIEIASAPIWLAKLGAAVGSTVKGGGITPTVIDVITMNEEVTSNAAETLGVELTPLDDTLKKLL